MTNPAAGTTGKLHHDQWVLVSQIMTFAIASVPKVKIINTTLNFQFCKDGYPIA